MSIVIRVTCDECEGVADEIRFTLAPAELGEVAARVEAYGYQLSADGARCPECRRKRLERLAKEDGA